MNLLVVSVLLVLLLEFVLVVFCGVSLVGGPVFCARVVAVVSWESLLPFFVDGFLYFLDCPGNNGSCL